MRGEGWVKLGARPPGSLAVARLASHHAVQVLTHVARGYLPSRDDDSHTSLRWEPGPGALTGGVIPAADGPFTLALQMGSLTLAARNAGGDPVQELALAGKTMGQARAWVTGLLAARGLDPGPFDEPLHFTIPDHAVAHGGVFPVGDGEALRELARYYGNAAGAIAETVQEHGHGSPVRCWPHHFDIATLLAAGGVGAEGRTVGFGMSPGDGSYDQPYFYASPWPYPERSRLRRLEEGGRWHTEGWLGAVLPGEAVIREKSAAGQAARVRRFANEAVAALKEALSA